MARRLAELDGDTVIRVVVGESLAWAGEWLGGVWVECGQDRPGIGWTYDGTTFTPPYVFDDSEEPIGDDDAV
jgi:hypothetical protein